MALSTLYPPVMETYGKVFLLDSNTDKDICNLYFSLSQYNTVNDIKNVQVSIVYQDTNKNALLSSLYPSEIMLTKIKEDVKKKQYYIQIRKGDIKGGNFNINTYYKVQLRFTSTQASEPPTYTGKQSINGWLYENKDYFSEWSTVCLIRGISTPNLKMKNLNEREEFNLLAAEDSALYGEISFKNEDEKDTLKSYRMKLYDWDMETLLEDSGILYSNNYKDINQLRYVIKHNLQEGDVYYLNVEYTTNMLYTDSIDYTIIVTENTLDALNATIDTLLDEENGRIGVLLTSKDSPNDLYGSITIRRTSSESNYMVWEDMYSTIINSNPTSKLVWYDYSIDSGIFYKYSAQRRDGSGARGISIITKDPVKVDYEHNFLVGEEQQLRIIFNSQVDNYRKNVSEAKIDTIGSKYPFVRRNGNMNYSSFGLSGLITCFMDEDEIFTTENEILNGQQLLYKAQSIDINKSLKETEMIYERKFRDKVMEFLYEDKIRLFKSPMMKNSLIKLMDVSLSPVDGMNKILYSFTATCIEIMEPTIDNLKDNNIYSEIKSYSTKNTVDKITDSLNRRG